MLDSFVALSITHINNESSVIELNDSEVGKGLQLNGSQVHHTGTVQYIAVSTPE